MMRNEEEGKNIYSPADFYDHFHSLRFSISSYFFTPSFFYISFLFLLRGLGFTFDIKRFVFSYAAKIHMYRITIPLYSSV